jgi:hypothetical protein
VLAELRTEHDRLSDQYGVLDVKDPNKYYVVRLDTGDSKQFVWRVYQPKVNAIEYRVKVYTGGASSGSNFSPNGIGGNEFIYRYRFVFEDNHVDLHRLTGLQKGRTGIGDPALTELLKKHWDELEFQILEDGEYDVDEPLQFLTVRVPDQLLKELTQGKPDYYARLADRPLVEIVEGTPDGLKKLDSSKEP